MLEEAAGEEGRNDIQNHSLSVIGSFLGPRLKSSSPSSGPSQTELHLPSDVQLSEYNFLQSHAELRWNRLAITIWTLRHYCFCLAIFVLAMDLPIVLVTTLLVLTHAHKAAAKIDFTVDLGYAKYTGISAVDNKIVKWLDIRYAAPLSATCDSKLLKPLS